MPRPKTRKLSKKEAKALAKRRAEFAVAQPQIDELKPQAKTRVIELPQVVPVRKLAELAGVPIAKVIETLFKNGVKVTINESIDFDTAAIIGDEFNLEIKLSGQAARSSEATVVQPNLKPRPPIVTVMGHVDHGKTKLLDAIRKTNIAEKESGGITQHIGAYQVAVKLRKQNQTRPITFLDTPGHEAFSSLRAHGANITDIVVLVVAADDGVKPQTLEALSHARAANVPIIVALNKIDLPQADRDMVKRQLAQANLLPQGWGGTVPFVEISAKNRTGIDQLLEVILSTSDLNPPRADLTALASGAIVESHPDPAAGPLVTALVTDGILKVGATIAAGRAWGRVRFLKDWQGNRVAQAGPGAPVVVGGLRAMPQFGDTFLEASSQEQAKDLANRYIATSKILKVSQNQGQATGDKTLPIVVKADVSASLEAVVSTLREMKAARASVNIVTAGVGPVVESDVTMAAATQSQIIAFRVPIAQEVRKLASAQNVAIGNYDVIYKLTDEVSAKLHQLQKPSFIKKPLGKLPVLKVFMQAKDVAVVGGKVIDGEFSNGDSVEIQRSGQAVGEGKVTSLQRDKSTVAKATAGLEFGVKLTKTGDLSYKIKPGDALVAYKVEGVAR